MSDGPVWIRVRMTANRHRPESIKFGPNMLLRDHVYDVDASEPAIQHELRATWMVPLPASEQPSSEDLGLGGSSGGSPAPAPENSAGKTQ